MKDQLIEPCIVANTTNDLIEITPISKALPLLKLIALQWDLKLSRMSDFKIAKRILVNSAKYN